MKKDRMTVKQEEAMTERWNPALKLWMPRKVELSEDGIFVPMSKDGKAVYSLPGGREYVC